MSRYTVTRLIQSALHLGTECEIDGIRFEPVEPFRSDDVLVSDDVRAGSYRDASKLFDAHLLPVVDAVTVVTGAALLPLGGSTLIEKARSKYVYLHAVQRRRSAAMTLIPGHDRGLIERSAQAAVRLAAHPGTRHAAYYLRQAALAQNVLTSPFHTLQAAEALAGRRGSRTDHVRLKAVMGEDDFRFFYTKDPVIGENRRNALAHGRLIDETGLVRRIAELQDRLLGEVRSNVRGKGPLAFSPVRGFRTFEPFVLFLEPLSALPSLPSLIATAFDHGFHSASDPKWVGVTVSRRLIRTW